MSALGQKQWLRAAGWALLAVPQIFPVIANFLPYYLKSGKRTKTSENTGFCYYKTGLDGPFRPIFPVFFLVIGKNHLGDWFSLHCVPRCPPAAKRSGDPGPPFAEIAA